MVTVGIESPRVSAPQYGLQLSQLRRRLAVCHQREGVTQVTNGKANSSIFTNKSICCLVADKLNSNQLHIDTPMTDMKLLFAVDREKLFKLRTNYLQSKEGSDAISAGELKGEERLFMSLLDTHLLNTTMFLPQKSLIKVGEQFEEAYFLVSGAVQIKQGEKLYKLGAGSVLGLSEGMAGLPSKYTAIAASSIQVKIIPFHKLDARMNVLPPELKAILVTIIKRNLAA